jgi:hypothetical protein
MRADRRSSRSREDARCPRSLLAQRSTGGAARADFSTTSDDKLCPIELGRCAEVSGRGPSLEVHAEGPRSQAREHHARSARETSPNRARPDAPALPTKTAARSIAERMNYGATRSRERTVRSTRPSRVRPDARMLPTSTTARSIAELLKGGAGRSRQRAARATWPNQVRPDARASRRGPLRGASTSARDPEPASIANEVREELGRIMIGRMRECCRRGPPPGATPNS